MDVICPFVLKCKEPGKGKCEHARIHDSGKYYNCQQPDPSANCDGGAGCMPIDELKIELLYPPTERKAVMVDTNLGGLSFNIGVDGVWMLFDVGGQHAGISLSNMGQDGSIVADVIAAWCKQLKEKYVGGG